MNFEGSALRLDSCLEQLRMQYQRMLLRPARRRLMDAMLQDPALDKLVGDFLATGNSEALVRALALHPELPELHYFAGDARKCLELDPQHSLALGMLSQEEFAMGDRGKAVRMARQAIKLDPDCAPAFLTLTWNASIEYRWDEALAILADWLERDGRLRVKRRFRRRELALDAELVWGLRYQRGILEMTRPGWERLRNEWLELKNTPDPEQAALALEQLVVLNECEGNYEEANSWIAEIERLEILPDLPARLRGDLEFELDRWEEAEKHYRRALGASPPPRLEALTHAMLGQCALHQGDVERALAEAELAERICHTPVGTVLRAQLALDRQNMAEARDRANWLLEKVPGRIRYQLLTGQIEEAAGERVKARAAYKRCLDLKNQGYPCCPKHVQQAEEGARRLAPDPPG